MTPVGPSDVLRWLGELGYGLVFLTLLAEGTGLPGVPFEPLFLGTGYLISRGRMTIVAAWLIAAAGNVAGNVVGYYLGRAGRRLVKRGGRVKRPWTLTPEQYAKARSWFARYGGLTLIIGRWFGLIRTPAILAAGAMEMPLATYVVYSSIAALSWTLAWQVGAWKFQHIILRAWGKNRGLFTVGFFAVAFGGVGIVAALGVIRRRLRKQARIRKGE